MAKSGTDSTQPGATDTGSGKQPAYLLGVDAGGAQPAAREAKQPGFMPRIRAPVSREALGKFEMEVAADQPMKPITASDSTQPSWSLVSATKGVDVGRRSAVRVKIVR